LRVSDDRKASSGSVGVTQDAPSTSCLFRPVPTVGKERLDGASVDFPVLMYVHPPSLRSASCGHSRSSSYVDVQLLSSARLRFSSLCARFFLAANAAVRPAIARKKREILLGEAVRSVLHFRLKVDV